MIRFACTGCDARFTVDDADAGQVGECPACQARFLIPGADPRPLDAPSLPAPDVPSLPAYDPSAPVAVRACPACGADAAVRPADVGHRVECPRCAHEYRADALDPARAPRPKARRRRRDWGDPDRDTGRRRSRRDDRKPGNVTTIGTLLLTGGIYGLVHDSGILVLSYGCCLFWPFWTVSVVWSILAIVRGAGILSRSGGRPGRPWVLHTLQILCILNFDVVNCILGVVGLCLANTPDAQDYFERQTGYAADDE